MKRWLQMVLLVACAWSMAGALGAVSFPDGYPVRTGADFQSLAAADPERPDWLFATARGPARSADGEGAWMVYEFVLDRQVPFRHLLVELRLAGDPGGLHVRLLDGRRENVAPDLFGNIAARAAVPGNVILDVELARHPAAEIVQLLLPRDREAALKQIVLTPAAYEILMKTAGDFATGARTWIRTPIYDPKKSGLLSDLVLLEDGRTGDMSSPVSAFHAFGVEARPLEAWASAPVAAGTTFALDAMPLLARFDVALRNFDPLAPVELWLNGRPLGPLSLDLADLEDAAYWPPEPAAAWRVGRWTRAWFFIPPEALRLGDNRLELRAPPGAAADWEARDAGVQFKYPWEEIGTYSFVDLMRRSTRTESIAGGISPAPRETTRQTEDTVVLRVDAGEFRPIGPDSAKPAWLESVEREYPRPESRERQFRIKLNPANRPEQLGIDVICLAGGGNSPATVSLLAGDRVVAGPLLQATLNSGYIQMTTQLLVPLREHPEADTVLLHFGVSPDGFSPAVSRLQLKAAWPAAVLAAGQTATQDALADAQLDSRSALVAAEVLVPDGTGAAATVQHGPPAVTGEWYGVETRMLCEHEVSHGDSGDIYFTDWRVNVRDVPALARLDFLVMHLSVVDGMEVLVNGRRAGAVSLHLPGVQDANYVVFHVNRISEDGLALTSDEKYAIDYGAWARASLVFDGRLLRPGANTIRIGRTPRLKGTNDHYTFKRIRLQLKIARK